MSEALSDEERFDRLRLARSENVGPATYQHLLNRFGSARAALQAAPALARRGGAGRAIALASKAAIAAEREAAAAVGARLLLHGEAAYPALLAALDPPPPALWIRGRIEALDAAAVALVGTRNASANGARFAGFLAQGLVEAGWSVVSGLARGVDGAAHQAALNAGGGARLATAAVVAGGVDVVYPPEHAALQARIADEGAVISERAMGHRPGARDFPRRNRLISGLALGVVVVEGAMRSGSLITARTALEQGREVMAAPGHPFDARAEGCNHLIREGAMLIRHVGDVLEVVRPLAADPPPLAARRQGRLLDPAHAPPALDDVAVDAARAAIEAALGPSPTPIDALYRSVLQGADDLDMAALAAALVELELAGRLERAPGGVVTLIAEA